LGSPGNSPFVALFVALCSGEFSEEFPEMTSANPKSSRRATKDKKSFRIGKVRAYRREKIWYLFYREQGRRRQPRIGPDQDLARQTASGINAQLEVGIPSALGFEPILFE